MTVESIFRKALYERDGFAFFPTKASADNRLLYNNAKRIRSIVREAGVQFAGTLTQDGFFGSTISQSQSHRQEYLVITEAI